MWAERYADLCASKLMHAGTTTATVSQLSHHVLLPLCAVDPAAWCASKICLSLHMQCCVYIVCPKIVQMPVHAEVRYARQPGACPFHDPAELHLAQPRTFLAVCLLLQVVWAMPR